MPYSTVSVFLSQSSNIFSLFFCFFCVLAFLYFSVCSLLNCPSVDFLSFSFRLKLNSSFSLCNFQFLCLFLLPGSVDYLAGIFNIYILVLVPTTSIYGKPLEEADFTRLDIRYRGWIYGLEAVFALADQRI